MGVFGWRGPTPCRYQMNDRIAPIIIVDSLDTHHDANVMVECGHSLMFTRALLIYHA